MELNYSGAKTLEEVRAIKKAFWDGINQEISEGKWTRLSREEFDRQVAEVIERRRKQKEDAANTRDLQDSRIGNPPPINPS